MLCVDIGYVVLNLLSLMSMLIPIIQQTSL